MNPEGPGVGDIWVATRRGHENAFADPRPLPGPVNTVLHDIGPWITHDWPAPGSKLYFTRYGLDEQNGQIFEATWHVLGEGETKGRVETLENGSARDSTDR